MKKMILNYFGTFIVLFFVAQLNINAQTEASTKLYSIAFHADYCGACKAIGPKVGELSQKLDGKPVEFVKFDFTSDESKAKTSALAEEIGFTGLLEDNRGTGFVLF